MISLHKAYQKSIDESALPEDYKQYFKEYEAFDIEIIDVQTDDDVKNIENKMNHEVFSMLNKPLFKIKFFSSVGFNLAYSHIRPPIGYSFILSSANTTFFFPSNSTRKPMSIRTPLSYT
mgnify:CR=1 FL=1